MGGQRNTRSSGPVRYEPSWETRSQPVQRPFLPPVPVRHSTTEQLPVQRPASLTQPAVRPEPGPAPRAIVPYVPPPPPARRVRHRRRIVEPRRRRQRAGWPTLTLGLLAVTAVLLLATLNCALYVLRSQSGPETDGYNYVVMVDRLPTLTPTANAVAVAQAAAPVEAAPQEVAPAALPPTPTPTFSPSPTVIQSQPVAASQNAVAQQRVVAPTPTPSPTLPPTPTQPSPTPGPTAAPLPAAAPESPGSWTFVAMRSDAQPARRLLVLFGELVNDTGTTQKITAFDGTFYDAQGGVIVANKSMTGLWPTRIIPPGGQIPFALTVRNIQDVANFELAVEAEPLETSASQNFEFTDVTERQRGAKYCLGGAMKNPSPAEVNSLVVAAILYDAEGHMLRFATDYAATLGAEATKNFEVCLESMPPNVARHELRAWGI